jgi:prenylcysteine oxidase/farnesylcysteine lyase
VNAYGNILEPVELGASIFVDVNTILKNSSITFGLRPKHQTPEADDSEVLGIWNGQTFVYTQKDSGWKYWDIAKLLWKYGLAPIRTQRLMKSTVGKFLKLYEAPFFPFRSLSDRAMDLDLTSVTSVTGAQYLEANSVSPQRNRTCIELKCCRSGPLSPPTLSKPVLESTMVKTLVSFMALRQWFVWR